MITLNVSCFHCIPCSSDLSIPSECLIGYWAIIRREISKLYYFHGSYPFTFSVRVAPTAIACYLFLVSINDKRDPITKHFCQAMRFPLCIIIKVSFSWLSNNPSW